MKSSMLLVAVLGVILPLASSQIFGYSYGSQNQWPATCQISNQSPISFAQLNFTNLPKSFIQISKFAKNNVTVTMSNQQQVLNFHTNDNFFTWYAPDSTGKYVNFTSQDLQVHSPAEHQFDDSRDLEFQFRGQSTNGEAGVVVIQFKVDNTYTFESEFISNFANAVSNGTQTFDFNFHGAFFNEIDHLQTPSVVYYVGSDTQPPCSANFNWYIIKSPGSVTSAQLQQFSVYMGNNRRTQAVNGRQVQALASLQIKKSAANLIMPLLTILALIFTVMLF